MMNNATDMSAMADKPRATLTPAPALTAVVVLLVVDALVTEFVTPDGYV